MARMGNHKSTELHNLFHRFIDYKRSQLKLLVDLSLQDAAEETIDIEWQDQWMDCLLVSCHKSVTGCNTAELV